MADETARKTWPGLLKRAVPTDTLGSTATADIAGYVVEVDSNPKFTGGQRYKNFDDMVRDTSIVAAGVRLFLNLISNADWTVNPAEGQEDNPKAQEIADLAFNMIHDMNSTWANVVRKTALYRFYGFSVLEWTAKRRPDGAIGLLDVSNRPQRSIARWNRDANGTVTGAIQQLAGGREIELPRAKIVYAVDDTLTDSPEGMGLFRHLAATNDRLKGYLDLEKVGFETDLRGIPVVRAPLGELKSEVDAAEGDAAKKLAIANRRARLKPLTDWLNSHLRKKDSGLMLPGDVYNSTSPDGKQTPSSIRKWAIELLQGDSTSFADVARAIERTTHELARILGVEHLLLGANGGGSLALAQSKVGTFYLTITATALDLVETFERDLIKPLGLLNAWPDELMPVMGIAEIRDQDISEITTALAQMAAAGAVLAPDDPAIGEIRDLLGLSRPDPHAALEDAALTPEPRDPDKPLDKPGARVEKRWIKRAPRVRRSRRKAA